MTKPLQRFQIDILGPKPEEVSIGELTEFLRGLEQAVAGLIGDTQVPMRLSLVDIEEGSDRLTLATEPVSIPNIALLSATLQNRSYADLPRVSHQALTDMAKVTKRNNWGFRFVANPPLRIEEGELPPGADVAAPVVREVKGATSILAKCMRVGGAVAPRAELRLPNRSSLLHVDISEKLAKELGGRLYEDVVLAGEATWDADTWEVLSFAVTSISSFEPTALDLSFRELAESAGGAWDAVDAESFVQAQRGEQD